MIAIEELNKQRKFKRAFCLWHRRAGKDKTLWNIVINEAVQKTGIYYYFLPTYTQGKKIIWDGIDNSGMKFIDHVPEILVKSKNGQEMKIELVNGSIIQIIGTDNYDAIRGTNPVGCIFSEYAFQNPQAWEVVKPILRLNGGWAIFNTTPNGKNHAYDLWNMAQGSEDWFTEKLTIDDTGLLTEADMAIERKEGMTEEMIQQEYYVSFDVGALGAYYSKQIQEASERIVTLPWEPNKQVDCYFDLGRNDETSIGFVQDIGLEIRIIDHFKKSGEAISYYINILREKPYSYGIIYLPHDAKMKRIESRKSVEEQFKEAGFKTKIVKKLDIQQGIQQVRKIFPRLYFDKEKTLELLRSIGNYHKEYDETAKVFKNNPKHDWSSHDADMLRYLAVGHEETNTKRPSYSTTTGFNI